MIRLFLFMAIPVILQIVCIMHVIRNGKGTGWIYVIIFLPLAGSIAYFVVEILPGLKLGRSIDAIKDGINKVVIPGKKIRDYEQRLYFSDTFDNRMKLADEYFESGYADKAVEMYKKCLDGIYGEDPGIIYKLALAYFMNEDINSAGNYMAKLKQKDGSFKKFNEWKLNMMILEKQGDNDLIENEYEKYAEIDSDFEAIYMFGMFLKKNGKTEKALEMFNKIVMMGELIKDYTFHNNREWIRKAKTESKLIAFK